ncbi:hypothetical protein IT568_10800 [bacterium]|nr:hypothetical protein [bacterium]
MEILEQFLKNISVFWIFGLVFIWLAYQFLLVKSKDSSKKIKNYKAKKLREMRERQEELHDKNYEKK